MASVADANSSRIGRDRKPGAALFPRDRDRHAPARHDRRADPDLDRLSGRRPVAHRRGRISHPAQSLEPLGPDLGHRGHEHRHGAHHRDAPHRSLGRLDAELHRRRDRRGAGLLAVARARLRPSRHLDHRRRHRARARRRARRFQWLPRRLCRHPLLYRHVGRPDRLQRRRLVGDPRRDRRPDGQPLRIDRRHAAGGLDRGRGKLGAWRGRLRRHCGRDSFQPRRPRPIPLPPAPDLGGVFPRHRRLRPDARHGLSSSTPIPGRPGSPRPTPRKTISRFPPKGSAMRMASPFPC